MFRKNDLLEKNRGVLLFGKPILNAGKDRKGLLGKKVGDLAEITVPQGKLYLEITSISF